MQNLHTHQKRCLAILSGLLLTAASSFAAGYALYETNASGFAMGHATMGQALDASSIYMNPATMTQLGDGTQVVVGASASKSYLSVNSYNVPGGAYRVKDDLNDDIEYRPYIYLTQALSEDLFMGISFNMPYGVKTEYKPTWAQADSLGNYNELKAYNINPNLAYRLATDTSWAKQLSLSVGIQIVRAEMDATMVMPDPLGGANIVIRGDGKDTAFGFNIGLLWEINDEWSLGLSYRSKVELKYDDVNTTAGAAFLKYDLPETFSIGLNYSPSDELTLGVQGTFTRWSKAFQTEYEYAGGNGTNTSDWKDRWMVSAGLEYKYSELITLRAGAMYDQDPVTKAHADFMVPMGDRITLSAGIGFNFTESIRLDVTYAYVSVEATKTFANQGSNEYFTKTNSGHYNIVSAALCWKF